VEILSFEGQNKKKKIKKFSGLAFAHPEMCKSYPSFFKFLSQKSQKSKF